MFLWKPLSPYSGLKNKQRKHAACIHGLKSLKTGSQQRGNLVGKERGYGEKKKSRGNERNKKQTNIS
jgi:hypothetical protein